MKKITYNYSFVIKYTNVHQPKKRYTQGWVWEDLRGKASAGLILLARHADHQPGSSVQAGGPRFLLGFHQEGIID